ncbi:MAG: hypothetical protein ACO3TS_08275 [Candidatus Nanopelagicales bacterium]
MRLAGEEILRRIYVVFQDRNWTARPWHIVDEVIDDRGDSFTIHLSARGTFDAKRFTWAGTITGTTDGTVTYEIDGTAGEPFLRNRLGVCVLHPMAGFADRECTVTHPDGSTTTSAFPGAISPHQPFMNVSAMEWPVPGGFARLDFAGEVFETEDHRNWSDASYKTYCTPISLPFPVEVQPGDAVRQEITLSLRDVPVEAPPPLPDGPVDIIVGDDPVPLPSIGVHLTDPAWTDAECADLATLGLGHVHADIDAQSSDAPARIHDAADRARRLGTRLFIALHAQDGADEQLGAVLTEVGDVLAGVWVFHPDEKVTARATLDAWRSRLGPDLPWGCGSNLYFTELNRQSPDTTGLDWTTFSVNPQVHAWDDRSVMQNTATLEVIASEVQRLSGTTRVHVGPITLKPRFNPNATDPESDVSSTDLPADVDARQPTSFAAAWAALTVRSLSAPGTVGAITIFDDLDSKGLRARDGSPGESGATYPVFDVLAAISGATRAAPTASSRPEEVDALVIDGPSGRRAVVVNLTDSPAQARLIGDADATVTLEPHDVVTINLPRRNP